ncbi:uncharacterized protein EI97DRAFT_397793 [Westerdykella ornata]|uniref:DH domain-containing protein n=1 Tax=Westerdykella ornata TaxID=318751 RepID=A0A6A6JPG4_WESOR|nr:uncharacterized protein EI97DRAFT_397793 [Westerdykella ornata]KAF2276839.1 hypothetical protein EI97DRAFT_397793 [Westerdykella ornata]
MPTSPSPPNPFPSLRQKKDATPAKAKGTITEKQTAMKGGEFGKAIGIDKPANVRAKIQKWQAELEADKDAGAKSPVASAASPKPPSTPKAEPVAAAAVAAAVAKSSPKPAATPNNKSVEILPEKPKSAKKPTHNPLDEEVVIATAPKKRVVSDSHWRTNKSPSKDAGAGAVAGAAPKPSPKALPTAWVRPAARRAAASPETKPSTPNKPESKPIVLLEPKSGGQRTRSARRRRPSQILGSGNEKRPTSSGSGSSKAEKGEHEDSTLPRSPKAPPDKFELVRVRRRRRSGPSPRSSLSADDATPVKKKEGCRSEGSDREDTGNQIIVEYESTLNEPVRENTRQRQRRAQRRRADTSPEALSRETQSKKRNYMRRRSHQPDGETERAKLRDIPTPSTPPNPLGNRLQAWLQTTPDPFLDEDARKRRKSRDSVSTLELPPKKGASQTSLSSEPKEEKKVEDIREEKEGSGRKRRSPRPNVQVKTRDLDELPSMARSSDITGTTDSRDTEGSPTPKLKRRGARRSQHSPTKERARSPPAPELQRKDMDDGTSVVSSSVVTSSVATSSVLSSSIATSSVISSSVDSSSVVSSSVDASTIGPDEQLPVPRLENPAMRRIFPTTGKRLSTIASVETFTTKLQNAAPSVAIGSEVVQPLVDPKKKVTLAAASEASSSQVDADTATTLSRRSTRRNRLASHADLISVLSMPRTGTRSIVSARSIRTNRSRLATATVEDIMNELASDEVKYMRELRTLVDGVIPVLLNCVLSKSDSAVAAGLFSRSSKMEPSDVTKPIVDMGVCLDRLKMVHKRVPKANSDQFLSWAQSAQRIYNDYINAWRLGFEDVVVSLAPADEDPFTPAKVVHGPDDAAPWDEGLAQNAEGYVVNGDGERVDVAYMLKRPLVRLKYLAKTIRGINHVKPSDQAEKMSNIFQDLVTAARKRSHDERARLEDEAAASIDPTRARDPRSLAPLAGVRIDPSRCVRARDYFDMHLVHSSGQEINCQVELLLRDNASGVGTGGDILLCEVDAKGRWLLLPPIELKYVSARNGDLKGEVVVMIRGYHGDGTEWREVFSLRIDDEQAAFEWVQMLGLQPVPPQISELKRDPSILNKPPRPASSHATSSLVSAATGSTDPEKSRSPSPHEVEIPIGEQAIATSKKWDYATPDRRPKSSQVSPITPPSTDASALERPSVTRPESPSSPTEGRRAIENRETSPRMKDNYDEADHERTPRSLNEAMRMAGRGSPVGLRRAKAKRRSKNLSPSPASPSSPNRPSRQIVVSDPEDEPEPPRRKSTKRRSQPPLSSPSSELPRPTKGFSVWMPSSDVERSESSSDDDRNFDEARNVERSQTHRRVSSVPSMEFPTIPRIRKTSQPTTPVKEPNKEEGTGDVAAPPDSAPPRLGRDKSAHTERKESIPDDDEKPPPVPPHRSPSPASPVTLKGPKTPVLTPTLPGFKTKRRSSSPLKHEYEPSTATESSSESEEEGSDTDDQSVTSSSTDGELDDDVPMPLMPTTQPEQQFQRVSPPASIYTLPNDTITPSQSASNTPYRAVPQGSGKASRAIASIFSWSDVGRWDSLHPEECSIVVTPGKIQAYEITEAHSKPFLADGDDIMPAEGRAPLIALDLTPLVPMRKSTAIDITIRSPPTAESRLKSGNNVMFRSRNPAECAQLYAMINYARINNPTYIALQNARGPYGQPSWAEAMDRQNAARSNAGSSSGWFSGTLGRRSSYRKTNTRAASISAVTESSVGTMNTALRSALARFSFSKNGRFNIRGSTLGSRSLNSFDTGSSGSGGGASTPPLNNHNNHEPGRAPGAPPGITNTKCRLYERDSFSSKWRDMGSARLSIMLPDPVAASGQQMERHGRGGPGVRDPSQEKRIVVVGKTKGEVLLDATLGESCFERVARSGIAVSVWEDVVGEDGTVGTVGKVGGVSAARARVYMIQMKSERECAYSFSLLGKLRY